MFFTNVLFQLHHLHRYGVPHIYYAGHTVKKTLDQQGLLKCWADIWINADGIQTKGKHIATKYTWRARMQVTLI